MADGIAFEPTDRGWKTVLTVDGEAVSGLSIVDQKTRVGTAGLKMGGIAGVWTKKEHRMQGHASRVMWASVEEMARRNYDVSILFGIADFYHRYGYAVSASDVQCAVRTASLPSKQPKGFRLRVGRMGDIPRIVSIYGKANEERPATRIRGRNWQPIHGRWGPGWRMPRMGPDIERRPGRAIVAEDGSGRIVAYVVFDAQDERCFVVEAAGDRAAFPALAVRLRKEAAAVSAERVSCCVPTDDPFGEFLGRFGAVWSVSCPANGGSMARIISLTRTFRKLLPTLDARLGDAGIRTRDVRLSLATDLGTVTLAGGRDGLALVDEVAQTRVSISQIHLTQLLFGYRSVEDLAIEGQVKGSARLLSVLSVLFPRALPYIWWGDRF